MRAFWTLKTPDDDAVGLADDQVSGSRYQLSLLRGVLFYRLIGGVVPIAAVIARHGIEQPVLTLVAMWAYMLIVSVGLWRVMKRRHMVEPRLITMGLIVDGLFGVAFNLCASWVVPGSVQDSFGDVFWFLAQVNVAAWALLRPGLAPGSVVVWSGIAWLMILVDPDRPNPTRWLPETGFITVHAVWLILAVMTLIAAGRLIRLGSSSALIDGVQLGRRAAQLQAMRDTHDTVLQTLEALALAASDPGDDPGGQLRRIGRIAGAQAQELRESLQGPTTDDDIRVMLLDLRQRFAGRLDIEVDFLDSARVVQAPLPVWAALRGAVHECLTNVVKHSGVREAFIQVDRTSEAVRISVRDRGRGFLPAQTPFGFGLTQSVIQRLEEVGGHVRLSSTPGGGALVALTAPLARSEPAMDGWSEFAWTPPASGPPGSAGSTAGGPVSRSVPRPWHSV